MNRVVYELTDQNECLLTTFWGGSNVDLGQYQNSEIEGKVPLTPSMRMILPEQELVVKNSSQLFSRDTTCSMSWSTLPFLLRSSFFRHCFFHWLNVFSMAETHTVSNENKLFLPVRQQTAPRRVSKETSIHFSSHVLLLPLCCFFFIVVKCRDKWSNTATQWTTEGTVHLKIHFI